MGYESNSPGHDYSMCSICMSDYSEDHFCATLPCGHTFHEKCMRQWLAAGRTDTGECPLCKAPLLINGVPVSQIMAAQIDALFEASSANGSLSSQDDVVPELGSTQVAGRTLVEELEAIQFAPFVQQAGGGITLASASMSTCAPASDEGGDSVSIAGDSGDDEGSGDEGGDEGDEGDDGGASGDANGEKALTDERGDETDIASQDHSL